MPPHKSPRLLAPLLTLATTLALLSPTLADTVTLRDGKTLTGEITAEDPQSLTLRLSDPSSAIAFSRKISRSQVTSITRPRHEGPPYVLLPVTGMIGVDITAPALQAGLDEAAAARPKFIVLDIDSPGGSIKDLVDMLDALSAAQQPGRPPIVAHVKNAYSAAAILAMSCKQIYLDPHGVIGAAVPLKYVKNLPADIDAKFRSAIEAKQRTYVVEAGHDPLLLRGMMEMSVEIYLSKDDAGHPLLRTEPPGTLLKAKDTILTLTAAEATACGLAHTCNDLDDLGKQLAGGPWYEASSRPRDTLLSVAASQRRTLRDQAASGTYGARSRTHTELTAVTKQLTDAVTKANTAANQIDDLRKKRDADVAQVRSDYKAAIANAKTQAEVARAKDDRDARLSQLHDNYDAAYAKLHADYDAAATEAHRLRTRANELLASLPTN